MRLNEKERDDMMNDHNGHYTELLKVSPGWEIEPGFGLTQLRALEADYIAQREAIQNLQVTQMDAQRTRRDGLFGLSNQDPDGVWMWLLLYKANARLHLARFASKGEAKALSATTPVLGPIGPGTYDAILGAYIAHWKLVNAAVPADKPLVLADLTLPALEAKRAQMAALIFDIDETSSTQLAVMRAKKEQLFGDVSEEKRENDSLIAYLLAYHTLVETQFAGGPLAQTLPRIFPAQGAEIRFPFGFKQVGATVTVWFEMPEVSDASVVYLKEGAFEETVAIPTAAPFKVTFTGVTVQEEVDELELRDAGGKTVAFGRFDGSLVEPV